MPIEPRRFNRLYGVLGFPLGHSLSPALHNWGFSLCRLPGVYLAFEKTGEELAAFVSAVRSLPIHGVSVTLPHKQTIIPLLDGITERAKDIGAVNTLYWEDGRLMGENTDILGFLQPLQGRSIRKALVLGCGGVALAVLAALAELGAEDVAVAARDPGKAAKLLHDRNVRLIPWKKRATAVDQDLDLVVNTTPRGMAGHAEAESPMPSEAWQRLKPECTAFDVVYNPLQTRFLREAAEAGLRTQDGLDFFAAQGLAQFLVWTDQPLPFGAAKIFLKQVLSERAGKSA